MLDVECVLEGPLCDCTCIFYFIIRRAGRSCLVGGLGAALKRRVVKTKVFGL